MSLITLRLDPGLQKELDLESKALKLSRSEVLRQALKDYFQRREERRFRAEMIKAASFRVPGADRALAEEFLPLDNEALMMADDMSGYKPKPRKRGRR